MSPILYPDFSIYYIEKRDLNSESLDTEFPYIYYLYNILVNCMSLHGDSRSESAFIL